MSSMSCLAIVSHHFSTSCDCEEDESCRTRTRTSGAYLIEPRIFLQSREVLSDLHRVLRLEAASVKSRTVCVHVQVQQVQVPIRVQAQWRVAEGTQRREAVLDTGIEEHIAMGRDGRMV
jgi:hypothetical protein